MTLVTKIRYAVSHLRHKRCHCPGGTRRCIGLAFWSARSRGGRRTGAGVFGVNRSSNVDVLTSSFRFSELKVDVESKVSSVPRLGRVCAGEGGCRPDEPIATHCSDRLSEGSLPSEVAGCATIDTANGCALCVAARFLLVGDTALRRWGRNYVGGQCWRSLSDGPVKSFVNACHDYCTVCM